MSDTSGRALILHELPPSPNNVKVRIALGYKGIEYERLPVAMDDPSARERLVEATGQPLTPVLQDGDRFLFDSHAIIRYLDANFPGPRLFFPDRERMREAEGLEHRFRTELGEVAGIVFGEFFKVMQGGAADPEAIARANRLWNERTGPIEERLGRGDYLMGDEMSFVDAVGAPYVLFACLPESLVRKLPPAKFFTDSFTLGDGRDRTRAWCARVTAHDPFLS